MEPRIDDEVNGTEVEPRSPSPRARRRSSRDVLFRISAWHVAAVAALFAVLLVCSSSSRVTRSSSSVWPSPR